MAVSVERIDGVVLGGDEEDIVAAFPWYFHAAEKERLGIDISVHVQGEESSKVLNVHVAGRQFGLVEIRAGARVVILGGSHPLCSRRRCEREDVQKDDSTITNPLQSALTHCECPSEDVVRSVAAW